MSIPGSINGHDVIAFAWVPSYLLNGEGTHSSTLARVIIHTGGTMFAVISIAEDDTSAGWSTDGYQGSLTYVQATQALVKPSLRPDEFARTI